MAPFEVGISQLKVKEQQDVFVKHECPHDSHFFLNMTLVFDLDLGNNRCVMMRCAFKPNIDG